MSAGLCVCLPLVDYLLKKYYIVGIFGLLFIVLPLIILFVVLGIGITLVRSLLRVFGLGNGPFSRATRRATDGNARARQRETQSQDSSESSSKPKKIIAEDEGEYVDFEEVK